MTAAIQNANVSVGMMLALDATSRPAISSTQPEPICTPRSMIQPSEKLSRPIRDYLTPSL
jgi:hypothetical protein